MSHFVVFQTEPLATGTVNADLISMQSPRITFMLVPVKQGSRKKAGSRLLDPLMIRFSDMCQQ
jgi:hypothetical protein